MEDMPPQKRSLAGDVVPEGVAVLRCEYGWGLFATRPFAAGDTVLQEQAARGHPAASAQPHGWTETLWMAAGGGSIPPPPRCGSDHPSPPLLHSNVFHIFGMSGIVFVFSSLGKRCHH